MLSLQARGCGNINLVTPSHVVPMDVDALVLAARSGLRIPVVWNSSGYDCVEVLRLLEGVVDVWLPDLRYSDGWAASECSSAPDYVDVAHAALLEMARQVGTEPIMGPEGYLLRGMIIRLLVLPNDMAGVRESLDFILEHIGSDARVALMSQYFPSHLAPGNDLLSRRPTPAEYLRAVNHAERLGFRHALVQEMEAADFYRPDFNLKAELFADADRFTGKQPVGRFLFPFPMKVGSCTLPERMGLHARTSSDQPASRRERPTFPAGIRAWARCAFSISGASGGGQVVRFQLDNGLVILCRSFSALVSFQIGSRSNRQRMRFKNGIATFSNTRCSRNQRYHRCFDKL